MKLSRHAITVLTRQYKSILSKCALINAGLFLAVAPAMAEVTRVVVEPGDSATISDPISGLDNSALTGGAAQNSGELIVNEEINFSNNTAHAGGAIYSTGSQLTVGDSVMFIGNKTGGETPDAGAAIYAMGNETPTNVIIGDSVQFVNNASAQKAGAIFLEDANLTIGDSVLFEGNSSVANAGVLYNWNYLASDAQTTIGDEAQFLNNTAGTNGGVIANYDGKITLGELATFSTNKAGGNGGAVLNSNYLGTSVMTIADGATFENNVAEGLGGAVYNTGDLTINGSAEFSGNMDSTGANDIYNSGKLTLNATTADDVITLEGGISGDAESKGTTNVNGLGVVQIANALKNQNVNNEGQLALNGADLSGTTIAGDGIVEVIGDSSIEDTTMEDQTFDVDEGQTLDFENVTLNETADNKGTVTVADGASLNIKDSHVNVKVINNGILYSDPTYYTKQVVNTGTATFDGDTFEVGSELENTVTVNLLNGTEFKSGVAITDNGTTNLVEGTMKFNDTASSNNIHVNSGANWTGNINSTASVNTQNGSIDSITGTVTGGDLYIDANLGATATADTFGAGSTGTIKSINITSSEYGTYAVDDTKTIALNGLTLDSAATITGMSYYTKVEESGGNLVFSDKLVNTSGIQGTGDTTTPAGDVVLGSVADTTTIGTTDVNIALDNTGKTIDMTSGSATKGATVGVESGTTNAVTISAADSTTNKSADIDVNGTNGKIKLEATDTGASKTAKVEIDGNGTVTATAASGFVVTDGTNDATLTAKTTGLDIAEGLTVGGTAYGIDSTGAGSLASLQVGGKDVLTEADIAPAYSGTTMADVTSYVSTNGAKIATVADTAGVINTVFDAKQTWLSGELGYDTKTTDAKTILSAAGFTNQTTGDTDVGLIDAALQLKADKQDKLDIKANSGLKWNDTDETQLAIKLADTSAAKSGLQLSNDGLSIKTGDTMQISNEGFLNIKYDSNIFKTDPSAGLQIKDEGITNSMIKGGAVTIDKLATSAYSSVVSGSGSDSILATTKAVKDYADTAVSNAIQFNSDNTVTLTVGSNSADLYNTTGTANYVKANAQEADYTHIASAVDLTSDTTIKLALQTLDAQKASLKQDNIFEGANTFKSDSGVTIQNKTTPAIQSNLVATQLTIGADSHDVLQLTVSNSTTNGGALYVKDADIVTNKGFTALDDSGVDRFSADEDGIETKDASGNTTFSVDSATGNTTVAGTFSAAGNKFTVDGDGAVSAANNKFQVTKNGGIIVGGSDKYFVVEKDGDVITKGDITADGELYAANKKFHVTSNGGIVAADGKFIADKNGNVTAAGEVEGKTFANTNDTFKVDENGNINSASITTTGNAEVGGALAVHGMAYLQDAMVNHDLAVANDATVGGNFAVTGTSNLHDTNITGNLVTSGDATIGTNLGVQGTTYLHNTFVTGDMAVSGTTKTTALTFDGTSYVAAMDQGAAAVTSGTVDDQAKRTMATNATVAKTVGNLAALATAANGVTSANDVADAINSLGQNVETATGGTFDAAGVWTGTVTGTKAVNYTAGVAYNDLISAIDQVSSNIGAAPTAAKGNIVATNTVNANLDSLDAAIGDRSFATTKYIAPNDDLATAATKLDTKLYSLDHDVRKLRHDMDRGLASVSALSALIPNARGTGNTTLSFGTGYYNGHSSMAFGGAHWFTDNLMVNVGAAASVGHTRDMTYRAGVSYSF